MSDKTIFIKRRPYTKDPKYGKAPELVAMDKYSIGSSLTESGATYKGLTHYEEELLMPRILNLPYSHHSFMEKSNEWFSDMKRKVPITHLKLNISLKDDSKPLSENNLPVVLEDYVLYLYVTRGYSRIAKSIDELDAKPYVVIYIDDPKIEADTNNAAAMRKVDAIREFGKIADNEIVLNAILKILSGKYKKEKSGPVIDVLHPETFDLKDKQTMISNIATANAEDFLAVVADTDLEKRAEAYEFISLNIIEDTGTTFVFAGREIGKTIEHVVAFIKSPSNSAVYISMKGRLEAIKDKIPVKEKAEATPKKTKEESAE
jgi:hypothetical protein